MIINIYDLETKTKSAIGLTSLHCTDLTLDMPTTHADTYHIRDSEIEHEDECIQPQL